MRDLTRHHTTAAADQQQSGSPSKKQKAVKIVHRMNIVSVASQNRTDKSGYTFHSFTTKILTPLCVLTNRPTAVPLAWLMVSAN